jgi:putative membrane protein
MRNLLLIGAGLIASAFAAFAEIRYMDDAQIADVVITANNIAIKAGKLAKSRSSNANIRAYTKCIVDEHSGANRSTNELAVRLNLTPRGFRRR